MKPIEFAEQNVIIAKDQPEYLPLPAHVFNDNEGTLICCWKLTFKERVKLILKGVIWHEILTFHMPLQPQLLTVDKPCSLAGWPTPPIGIPVKKP